MGQHPALIRPKDWTDRQRRMMVKAGKYHAVRGVALGLIVAAATMAALALRGQLVEQRKATHAAGLVERLLDADTAQLPAVVGEMSEYRKWTDPLLRQENDKAVDKSRQKLHTSLALLPAEVTQVTYLNDRLLNAELHELPVIRDALAPHKAKLLDMLWTKVENPEKGNEPQRLRAAVALAKYDPENAKWPKASRSVVDQLVRESPVFLVPWMEGFRPLKGKLLASLAHVYRDANRRESERSFATIILADYAADQPQVLADLLMDADELQFTVIYEKFKDRREQGLPVLIGELDKTLAPELPSSDDLRERLAKRQANAAVALLRLDQSARVWPLLKHSPDPRVRSYLIHRFGLLGADPAVLFKQLESESDVTIRRALLLCLGEFTEKDLTNDAREMLLPRVQELYRTVSDPGIHGASEWLLRQWKQEAWLERVNDEWAKDQEQRQNRLEIIGKSLAKDKEKAPPHWYVNPQGQTMVIIPGPAEFVQGSPTTEDGRFDNRGEQQHRKRIGRAFALSATGVTVKQYQIFYRLKVGGEYDYLKPYALSEDCPVGGVSWFMAAQYCNWLNQQENIPSTQWCYETDATGNVTKLKANYLSLNGYRLPTDAEWEYACRAGAVTSRYYGETEELLPHYGWYLRNSQDHSWPVGGKKPNDWGLFDMHGNIWTWCQETFRLDLASNGGKVVEDKEDRLDISKESSRVSRGGAFHLPAATLRSAYRSDPAPINRFSHGGCRLAKTLTY